MDVHDRMAAAASGACGQKLFRHLSLLVAVALIVSLTITSPAAAQDAEPQVYDDSDSSYLSISLLIENDSTPLKLFDKSDRQYTHGMGFLVTHQPGWARNIAEFIPSLDGLDDPEDTAIGYIIGFKVFSPDDLDNPNLIPNDRRYAGYSYIGTFLQRANHQTLDHFQIDLGWIGPSSGVEAIQENWHDFFGITYPEGWANQLPDEPTLQMTFRKKWRFDLHHDPDRFQHQLIPTTELSLGTVQRYASADLLWRGSWLPLPNDFGPGQLDDLDAPMAQLGSPGQSPLELADAPQWTAYLFGRAGMLLVQHDTFIEGSDFHDDTGLDAKPVVGRFQFGIEAKRQTDHGTFRIGFYQTFLTDQFDGQTRPHSYGGLTLTYAWRF